MNAIKNKSEDELIPDLAALRNDIAALTRDLTSAIAEFKANAVGGAQDAIDDLADRANDVSARLAKQGKRAVKSLEGQIEEQPMVSVLVAFAAGFILTRLMTR